MNLTNNSGKENLYRLDNRDRISLDNEERRKLEIVKGITGINSRNAIIKLALRLLFTKYGIF
jgi:hypothetical protein